MHTVIWVVKTSKR